MSYGRTPYYILNMINSDCVHFWCELGEVLVPQRAVDQFCVVRVLNPDELIHAFRWFEEQRPDWEDLREDFVAALRKIADEIER